MNFIKKKSLGQHFLSDTSAVSKIVKAADIKPGDNVLEIGPGAGAITNDIYSLKPKYFVLIEKDKRFYEEATVKYPNAEVINYDAADFDFSALKKKADEFTVVGNLPYNVATVILERLIAHKEVFPKMVLMFQKEVALRIASKHNNKSYGIISVLLQAYYDIEYLFTVDEHVFNPPPKVKSAVIRLIRKENFTLGCDEVLLKNIVKTSFNQRRKTLRNSLKALGKDTTKLDAELLNKRAEQLSVQDFIDLTNKLS